MGVLVRECSLGGKACLNSNDVSDVKNQKAGRCTIMASHKIQIKNISLAKEIEEPQVAIWFQNQYESG